MKKIVFVCMFVFLLGCSKKEAGKETLFVSITPQKFFVEKITNKDFDIEIMVPDGRNPASYEPLPKQMLSLSKAKIFFSIGVPFEKRWIKKIEKNNENLFISRTDRNIQKRKLDSIIEIDLNDTHNYHGKLDPHIWLDPILVKTQAENIYKDLIKVYPEHQKKYYTNLKVFQQQLDSINGVVRKILKEKTQKKFMVFHPSWGYFADRYGFKQYSIEVEGKEPSPNTLLKIINKVKELKISKILIQKQFSANAANAVAKELKAKVIIADPLEYDYYKGLTDIANKILEK